MIAALVTPPPDTLALDTARVAALRDNPLYDYSREFHRAGSSESLLERLLRAVLEQFDFNPSLDVNDGLQWLRIGLGLVGFAAFVFIVARYGRRWLARPEEAPLDYTVTEDNIYGIDFDRAIARARSEGNLREVVRLTYLQTLRLLDDNGCIDWQPHKTPRQYAGEVGNDDFNAMTRTFVRVRYGDYEVDGAMLDDLVTRQRRVTDAVAALRDRGEGGDVS